MTYEKGDVVQIITSERPDYIGCFVVVTEPKKWGVQGYICSPHVLDLVRFKDIGYVRVKNEEIEYVGKAPLIIGDNEE